MAKKYNPWTCFLEDTTTKAKDSKTCDGKNEYEIHYTVPGKNGTMVGSGKGTNEQEAKEDFMAYHKSESPTVTKVKLYKPLDKAIRNCDVKTSTRNVTTENIAFEEIKKLSGIIPEYVKEKGDVMEFYNKGLKVAEWDMNKAEVKVFV